MGGDASKRTGQGQPPSRPVVSRHQPITMRTLGDFQRYPGHMLWASCPRCGRYRTLDINSLARRFRPSMSIDKVGPLLRCSSCGGRGALTLGHSGASAPDPKQPSRS